MVGYVRAVSVAVEMRMRERTKLKRQRFERRIIIPESIRNFDELPKGTYRRSVLRLYNFTRVPGPVMPFQVHLVHNMVFLAGNHVLDSTNIQTISGLSKTFVGKFRKQ